MTIRMLGYTSSEVSIRLNEAEAVSVDQDNTNSFTVVIGSNGIGKSQLLINIAKDLQNQYGKISRKSESFDFRNSINDSCNPGRILAISNLVLDKFSSSSRDGFYKHLGAKRRSNISKNGIIASYISDYILFSLGRGSQSRGIRDLHPVLDLLGLTPKFKFDFSFGAGARKKIERLMDLERLAEAEYELELELEKLNQVLSQKGFVQIDGRPLKEDFHAQIYRKEISLEQFNQILRLSIELERRVANKDDIHPQDLMLMSDYADLELETFVHAMNAICGLKMDIYFERNGEAIGVPMLSSGEQLLLSMVCRIMRYIVPDSIVLIDEPEVGLHPNWQSEFVPLLRATIPNNYGCHIIMATHSPFIVSDSSDLLVPGENWGEFVSSGEKFFGRSVENLLYRVFHTRIVGNGLVEDDVRLLLKAVGAWKGNREAIEAYGRLEAIAGADSVELNSLLREASTLLKGGLE